MCKKIKRNKTFNIILMVISLLIMPVLSVISLKMGLTYQAGTKSLELVKDCEKIFDDCELEAVPEEK